MHPDNLLLDPQWHLRKGLNFGGMKTFLIVLVYHLKLRFIAPNPMRAHPASLTAVTEFEISECDHHAADSENRIDRVIQR